MKLTTALSFNYAKDSEHKREKEIDSAPVVPGRGSSIKRTGTRQKFTNGPLAGT